MTSIKFLQFLKSTLLFKYNFNLEQVLNHSSVTDSFDCLAHINPSALWFPHLWGLGGLKIPSLTELQPGSSEPPSPLGLSLGPLETTHSQHK